MRTKITPRSRLGLAVAASCLFLCSTASWLLGAADPVAEMASFSVFDQINLSDLAKTDVKTAHGVPMGEARFLSVQSCWVARMTPDQMVTALHRWDPLKHPELKVSLHLDIRPGAGPADFAKLRKAPDNSDTRSLVAATSKMAPELQVSREEAKKFTRGIAAEDPFHRKWRISGPISSPTGFTSS